jgi:beta-lactam-binding protein with PASTA domain
MKHLYKLITALFFLSINIPDQTYPQIQPLTQPQALQKVTVPKLIGMKQSDAEKAIQDAGLNLVNVIEKQTRFPKETVIRQRPAPGRMVPAGYGIVLIVSTGLDQEQAKEIIQDKLDDKNRTESKIPPLTGTTFQQAYGVLTHLGFTSIAPVPKESNEPRETVLSIEVDGKAVDTETRYTLDTKISIVVSAGEGFASTEKEPEKPEPEALPRLGDLSGKPFSVVKRLLNQNGVNVSYQLIPNEEQMGFVTDAVIPDQTGQTPGQIQYGDEVELSVSAGTGVNQPDMIKEFLASELPEIDETDLLETVQNLNDEGFRTIFEEQESDQPSGSFLGLEYNSDAMTAGDNMALESILSVLVSGDGPESASSHEKTAKQFEQTDNPPVIFTFRSFVTGSENYSEYNDIKLMWTCSGAQLVVIEKITFSEDGEMIKETIYNEPVQETEGFSQLQQTGEMSYRIEESVLFNLIIANSAGSATEVLAADVIKYPRIVYFESGPVPPGQIIQPGIQEQGTKIPMLLKHTISGPLPLIPPSVPGYDTYTDKLHWNIVNLSEHNEAFISPDIGDVDAVGSREISYSEPTLYTLTARNSAGTVTANCFVKPPKPKVKIFTTDPNPVPNANCLVRLEWEIEGADTVYIYPPGESVPNFSYIYYNIWEPTTFILLAANSSGYVQKELLVDVPDYEKGIYLFESDEDSVACGDAISLRYTLLGLGPRGQVELKSDPPVEHLDQYNESIDAENNMHEEIMFRIHEKTDFMLNVKDSDGKVYQKKITVKAGMTPDIIKFGFTDELQFWDQGYVTLEWVVIDAKRVILEPDFGSVDLHGTQRVEAVPRLYTLTAYGDPETLVEQRQMWLGNPSIINEHANITDFTVSPGIAVPDNRNIHIEWSGSGISATITKIRDEEIMHKWTNQPIQGHLEDPIRENVTYVLTISSMVDTVTDTRFVEYQAPPVLSLNYGPSEIIIGMPVHFEWTTQNLGLTGTVELEGHGQIAPSGSIDLYPQVTTVYRFNVKNQAGEDFKEVQIKVNPPQPYLVFTELPPAQIFRDEPYQIKMEIGFADSMKVVEVRPNGTKVILKEYNLDSWGTAKPKFSYHPMRNKPIKKTKIVDLEFKVYQKGILYMVKGIRGLNVLPNIDLSIEPEFEYSYHKGSYYYHYCGYWIYCKFKMRNNGKDVFDTSNIPAGETLRIVVNAPGFNDLDDLLKYEIVDVILGGCASSLTFRFDILRNYEIEPGQAYQLNDQFKLMALSEGHYKFETLIDKKDLVMETNEQNNDQKTFFNAWTGEVKQTVKNFLGSTDSYPMPIYYLDFPLRGEE